MNPVAPVSATFMTRSASWFRYQKEIKYLIEFIAAASGCQAAA
jgi:hypothetical protein